MHNIVNPRQTQLFDSFGTVLTDKTRKRLLSGWVGVFRHVILEMMTVGTVMAAFWRYFAFLRMKTAAKSVYMDVRRRFISCWRKFEEFSNSISPSGKTFDAGIKIQKDTSLKTKKL